MKYCIGELKHLDQIIKMKDRVREKIQKEKLDIWRNNYPTNDLLKEDIDNLQARVVLKDDKVIAYAVFYHSSFEYDKAFNKENVYSFGRLMVDTNYQGQDIGSFIVSSMIEEARSLNAEGIGIGVDNLNIKAVYLYKKHGFVKEGEKLFPWAYLDLYALYF